MLTTIAGTTPYPWPYDGDLDPARTALLLVGPSGAAGPTSPAFADARLRAASVATALADQGGVVLRVTTSPARVASAAQHPASASIRPVEVTARGVDGFFGSPLDSVLRSLGRDRLLLAGAWLESNVHSTMRSANDRGYECLLVLDACTAYDPALVPACRSQVEMSGGIFGAVGETASVLAALTVLAASRPSAPQLGASQPLEGTTS